MLARKLTMTVSVTKYCSHCLQLNYPHNNLYKQIFTVLSSINMAGEVQQSVYWECSPLFELGLVPPVRDQLAEDHGGV